jgi:hypothetical protein
LFGVVNKITTNQTDTNTIKKSKGLQILTILLKNKLFVIFKMCDDPLTTPFQKQVSKEKIEFLNPQVRIEYTGPTVKIPARLYSKTNTKSFINANVEFIANPPICDKNNSLAFSSTTKIGKLKTGPYRDDPYNETIGINLSSLFFNFFDLEIEANIIYRFDPNLVCNDSIPQTYNIDNNPFTVDIESVKFDESGYFVTNGIDEQNKNPLFNDLIPILKDPSGGFFPFFQVVLQGVLNQSGFGRQIEVELNRIICLDKDKQIKIPQKMYHQKIESLKRSGIYSLILGSHASNNLEYK